MIAVIDMPSPSALPPSSSSFNAWVRTSASAVRRRGRPIWSRPLSDGLLFAFYGRISTTGYQDPVSSRAWQIGVAGRLVQGRGRIVVEYFDAGTSRSVPWSQRAEAAKLLAAAADPDRGFDAVVVGEFERAFAAGQALSIIAQLNAYGVQVWLPELRGAVDLAEPEHRAVLLMLGHQSEREVLRNRFRTTAAMAAQVREQGRNLGGRPPYGYQLVDAGPHPNKIHASWGRRRHRLDVDPVTVPHVKWIFSKRLDGWSTAAIARTLNERRVPSPGAYDRARNPHRQDAVWTLRTVAAILANPRYTGRQVWNRQFTDHREAVPGDRRSSLGPVRVWSDRAEWVVSQERTHPALISDEDFMAAQEITAIAMPDDERNRSYALTGLLICGLCGRRLASHWNRKPAYRCRHGHTTAHPVAEGAPKWVYWTQERLFQTLQAARLDLAELHDANDLAAHLKADDLVIVCGLGELVIEPSVVEPGEEPTVEAEVAEAPADEPESGCGQLSLPIPPGFRRQDRRPRLRNAVVIKQRWKARNPTRHHVKRE
ncbi:recombinase family protein [Paractinoplanes atraurantiacus]|uniref:recombinase family protein n=1 Tax=Paractinoplanes atraurantiacus TaxID=1036182 RepID=UPI0015CEFFE4|nr:recombinase family protein [Actinoplanes atraurantiacus]